MKPFLTGLLLFCLPFLLFAQKDCGTIMKDKNLHKYPGVLKLNSSHVYTIPVIFHVVYNTENQNLPDALILETLNALHEDFLAINTDLALVPEVFKPFIGSPNINFVLANKLPNGTPTSGIIRKRTSTKLFKVNQRKIFTESPIIQSESYLNVYICNTNTNAFTPSESNPAHDGIVINYSKVNKTSRTLTHEAGHWLNLYHIFEGGCNNRDRVDDTPPQIRHSIAKCLVHPVKNCGKNAMFMNFMDYSKCRYFFTAGQVERMHIYIEENKKFEIASSFIASDTAMVAEINKGKVSFINLSMELKYPASLKKTIQQAYETSLPLFIQYDQKSGTILSCKTENFKKLGAPNTELALLMHHERMLTEGVQTELLDNLAKNQLDTAIATDKLTTIFNYLITLSCNNRQMCTNIGTPCITFKYKSNGCQARAHLMRYYLEDSFNVSCKKVFLFGRLRAKNTGSCDGPCVNWGWHVAPLVNEIDANGIVTPKIIDPSLFDKPVTIDEWKTAQVNCGSDANIDTMYIVDGKYYSWNFSGHGRNKKRYFYEDIDNYGPQSYTVSFLRSKCKTCNR